MRYYYYLYYRIYKFLTRIGKFELYHTTNHNINGLEMFFSMSVYILLRKYEIIPKLNVIILLIYVSLIMILNYFIFLYKKKYVDIIKMFENETKRQKQISSAIVLLIFFLNLFFFIYAITSY